MTTRFSEWTKKLGQQHFSMDGSSETLCGQAMLGNNYARYLYEEDKTPCPDCAQKKEFIEGSEIIMESMLENERQESIDTVLNDPLVKTLTGF